ncbi:MAG: type II toxin-antitoxin system RelE/ParE family toxin [Bacteroidota bacterium]
MARVIWSPQALADLEAIGDYLAREAPAYAQSFVDGAFGAVERLAVFPRSGRAVPEIGDVALRELIHRGYRIFHMVSDAEGELEVEILSVFHATRQFGGDEGLELG